MLRKSNKRIHKGYAVRVSVKMKDEIRLWDNAPSIEKALEWQEKELLEEMSRVGMLFDYDLTPVPIDKVEEARATLV